MYPFSMLGKNDPRFGFSVSVEGGLREDKRWHRSWYKKNQDVKRMGIYSMVDIHCTESSI